MSTNKSATQQIKEAKIKSDRILAHSRELAKKREAKARKQTAIARRQTADAHVKMNIETIRANAAEIGPIIQQNEKLETMQRQHEIAYTKQKYKLDQIQRTMFWNKILWMVYYLLVLILGVTMASKLTAENALPTSTFIIYSTSFGVVALFPYIVYPIEVWLWNQFNMEEHNKRVFI